MTARVLLTVSGTIPADLEARIAAGRRPRTDYLELARTLDAELIDHEQARREVGPIVRLLGRVLGRDVVLAWACHRRRHRYDVVFTDGEQVGIPLAALWWFTRRRPGHVMIAHFMSPLKKRLPFRLLRLQRHIDRVIVYADAQRRLLVDGLGVPAEHVVLSPFMVDTRFFAPRPEPAGEVPLISSAGLEFRDYPTLIDAVRGTDVRVVIAAASPWSKRADSTADVPLPANVEVRRLDHYDLRDLYAASTMVVVPVVETDFQAGITTILEAMAMGKPLICTRTQGQTDTVVDGETGMYVPPGDATALRAAIQDLLDDPDTARRLGSAARSWAVAHAELDVYCRRFAAVVEDVRTERR